MNKMHHLNIFFTNMLLPTSLLFSEKRFTNSLHSRRPPSVALALIHLTAINSLTTSRQSLYKRSQQHQRRHLSTSSSSTSSSSGVLDYENNANIEQEIFAKSDIPLVFVPGMKGTHLSYHVNEDQKKTKFLNKLKSSYSLFRDLKSSSKYGKGTNATQKKKRAWLTLSGLLNIPPLTEDHPTRSLALPLTYTDGRQDKGHLVPDGIIDHVVEVGYMEFLPFYGHVTKHLDILNEIYHQGPSTSTSLSPSSFIGNNTKIANEGRPTAIFPYDWRRPVAELSNELHEFCEEKFPNQPVQIVAHSLGGLITFNAMRKDPNKYKPGGVLVGVPFGTGIQYLQDLHRGYYTELNRCRQFTPKDQFTFSSHWIFFPTDEESVGDLFVDVTEEGDDIPFEADTSSIGKKVDEDEEFKPDAVSGENIKVNFQNIHEWEELEIGIFDPMYKESMDPKTKEAYMNHLKVQLREAKEWRENILLKEIDDKNEFPNLVICATNTVPTVNQILRREKKEQNQNSSCWEYDYVSGRSVCGDGRIDFDKAFPEIDVNMKKLSLDSLHAKQMCWEESGGSWGTIWNEVRTQLKEYEEKTSKGSGKSSGSKFNDANSMN